MAGRGSFGTPAAQAEPRHSASLAPVVLFCLLWSSAFAATKLTLPHCPPLILLAGRFLAAGGLMLGFAVLAGRYSVPDRRTLGKLVVLGLLNNALYLGFTFFGIRTVSSAFVTVLISTNPLLVALAAAPILGEKLTGKKIAGLGLGFVGVVVVMRSRLSGAAEDPHGTLLVLCGLLSLVAGTILFKKWRPRVDLWTGTGLQSLFGGLAVLPFALGTESLGDIDPVPVLAGGFAYLVIAVSIGAYWLWFRLLQTRTATQASALHFLMPPLGLFFGWLIFREPAGLLDLAGIVPIALGIALVTRS